MTPNVHQRWVKQTDRCTNQTISFLTIGKNMTLTGPKVPKNLQKSGFLEPSLVAVAGAAPSASGASGVWICQGLGPKLTRAASFCLKHFGYVCFWLVFCFNFCFIFFGCCLKFGAFRGPFCFPNSIEVGCAFLAQKFAEKIG